MSSFRTILVTTDLSEVSKSAFPVARTLAETFRAKLLVVYVQEDIMPPFVGEYAQTSIRTILDDQRTLLVEQLNRFVEKQLGSGVDTEAIVVAGIPHAEILDLARERSADLIVMATHGRGFLGHALFGSTTERIVRKAPCPVLTVRGHGVD